MICFKCGKKGQFANECGNMKPSLVCYNYGKEGNLAKHCKAIRANNNVMSTSRQLRARIFNMSTKEVV